MSWSRDQKNNVTVTAIVVTARTEQLRKKEKRFNAASFINGVIEVKCVFFVLCFYCCRYVFLEVVQRSLYVVIGYCPRRVLAQRVLLGCLLGFWPRGQNPRRHPRSTRVYTYKNKEYLLKK